MSYSNRLYRMVFFEFAAREIAKVKSTATTAAPGPLRAEPEGPEPRPSSGRARAWHTWGRTNASQP